MGKALKPTEGTIPEKLSEAQQAKVHEWLNKTPGSRSELIQEAFKKEELLEEWKQVCDGHRYQWHPDCVVYGLVLYPASVTSELACSICALIVLTAMSVYTCRYCQRTP